MLKYEPEVISRYSSFIIQDIINNNSKEIAEITEHLIKIFIKYFLSLSGLVISLTFLNITNFEPLSLFI